MLNYQNDPGHSTQGPWKFCYSAILLTVPSPNIPRKVDLEVIGPTWRLEGCRKKGKGMRSLPFLSSVNIEGKRRMDSFLTSSLHSHHRAWLFLHAPWITRFPCLAMSSHQIRRDFWGKSGKSHMISTFQWQIAVSILKAASSLSLELACRPLNQTPPVIEKGHSSSKSSMVYRLEFWTRISEAKVQPPLL